MKALARIEDPRARVKQLVATPGPAGEFAWTVLVALARVRRAPHRGDHRLDRSDRRRDEVGLRLGARPVRDVGRARVRRDAHAHEEGRHRAAGVDREDARGGREGFYARRRIWDPDAGQVRRARRRSARGHVRGDAQAAARRCSRTRAPKRGISATACSACTFKTKANSIDADVINMIHDSRSRAPSRTSARMVIWNQGEFFCVGANLFAVVMAAAQKQWEPMRRDGRAATSTRRSA